MSSVSGFSVFSLKQGRQGVNGGGLPGTAIIPIEALDNRVDSIAAGPHNVWVDDYLKMKERRRGDE